MRKTGFIKGIVCGLLLPIVIIAILAVTNVGNIGSLLQSVFLLNSRSLSSLSFNDKTIGAIEGMVNALDDPYSYYMNDEDYSAFVSEVQGSFQGIGIYIATDELDNAVVMSPIKGSPAFDAGLEAGDIILSVDGETTVGKTVGEIADLIQGEEGSTVDLEIKRGEEITPYTIERKEISIPTVEKEFLEAEGNIGYIAITLFNNLTGDDFKKALDELSAEHPLEGLIIDLRNNPGGSVTGATSVASVFVGEGEPIYKAIERKDEYSVNSENPEPLALSIVVLINENSASAAEILAGCLKDYDLATLVGQKTFGKGVIQTIYSLRGGGAVKVTTAKYVTPKGNDIHELGIEPNVEAELSVTDTTDIYAADPSLDSQLARGIEVLKEQIAP